MPIMVIGCIIVLLFVSWALLERWSNKRTAKRMTDRIWKKVYGGD
jgi:hypothetical protein